jgi:hypothetical protein
MGRKGEILMRMNSVMLQVKYRVRRRPWLMFVPVVALLLPVLIIVVVMLLGHHVETETRTVGQAVIDGWTYGGYDSNSNLVFQQGQQVVLLASSTKQITLNGKTIDLVAASPQALQIAKPEEVAQKSSIGSAPFWLLAGVGIGLLLGRRKPPGPKKPRASKGKWQKKWQPRRLMR